MKCKVGHLYDCLLLEPYENTSYYFSIKKASKFFQIPINGVIISYLIVLNEEARLNIFKAFLLKPKIGRREEISTKIS